MLCNIFFFFNFRAIKSKSKALFGYRGCLIIWIKDFRKISRGRLIFEFYCTYMWQFQKIAKFQWVSRGVGGLWRIHIEYPISNLMLSIFSVRARRNHRPWRNVRATISTNNFWEACIISQNFSKFQWNPLTQWSCICGFGALLALSVVFWK